MTAIDPKLVVFVAEHHKVWAHKPLEKIALYLKWHKDRELLATSFVGEDVFALCTVRFFGRLEEWLIPGVFDPNGAFALVDLLISVSPLAQADCFEQLFKRWGGRPIVIWERGDRTEQSSRPPRMYTWENFMKLTSRMTYGTVERERYYRGLWRR